MNVHLFYGSRKNLKKYQPYHIVEFSPWPFVIGCGFLSFPVYFLIALAGGGYSELLFTIILLPLIIYIWFRDVERERALQGYHTTSVRKGLNIAMCLFIASEVIFFLSIFWSFFHFTLSPRHQIGNSWPPLGISIIEPFGVPLLNTLILILSGVFLLI